jgi:hypothetical protein
MDKKIFVVAAWYALRLWTEDVSIHIEYLEYIEETVADNRQGVVLRFEGLWGAKISSP